MPWTDAAVTVTNPPRQPTHQRHSTTDRLRSCTIAVRHSIALACLFVCSATLFVVVYLYQTPFPALHSHSHSHLHYLPLESCSYRSPSSPPLPPRCAHTAISIPVIHTPSISIDKRRLMLHKLTSRAMVVVVRGDTQYSRDIERSQTAIRWVVATTRFHAPTIESASMSRPVV